MTTATATTTTTPEEAFDFLLRIANANDITDYDFMAEEINEFLSEEPSDEELIAKMIEIQN